MTQSWEQLQLFRPQSTRAATEGDKPALESFENFVAKPSVMFHGTFRSDWEDAPTAHFGTRGQATVRLHNVARGIKDSVQFRGSYYSGGDDDTPDDYEPDYDEDEKPTHVGRVYARDLPNPAATNFTDTAANRADYMYQVSLGKEDWEIPKSIRESAAPLPESYLPPSEKMDVMKKSWPTAAEGARELVRGHSIRYRNQVEAGSIFESRAQYSPLSAIARPANTDTWEEGRINDPNTSAAGKAWAQQRIDQGTAGSVSFEGNEYSHGTQGTIDGGARWGGIPKLDKDEHRNLSHIQFTTDS